MIPYYEIDLIRISMLCVSILEFPYYLAVLRTAGSKIF